MKNNILYALGCEMCQEKYNKKLSHMLNKLSSAIAIALIDLEMGTTEFLAYVLAEIDSCQDAEEEDDHA